MRFRERFKQIRGQRDLRRTSQHAHDNEWTGRETRAVATLGDITNLIQNIFTGATTTTKITSSPGVAGTDNKYAREDHTHEGMPSIRADTYDALNAETNAEGVFGYVTGTGNTFVHTGSNTWLKQMMTVDVVNSLPAIPTEGYRRVFWSTPNGDNQCWEAFAGQTRWTPCQHPTTRSGVP